MSSKVLRITLADGRVREIALDQLAVVPAEAGVVYAVVDAEGKVVAEDVQVSQVENDLVVEVEEQAVARIEDFYSETGSSSFSLGATADGTAAQYISSADAMVESSDVAWSSDSETLAAAEAGGISWPWLLGGAAVVGGGIALAANQNDSTPVPAAPTTNTNVVMFDLSGTTAVVSNHSGQVFDPNVSYNIYIVVPTDAPAVANPSIGQYWGGWGNLGADDTIYITGTTGLLQLHTPAVTNPIYGTVGVTNTSRSSGPTFLFVAFSQSPSSTYWRGSFTMSNSSVRWFDSIRAKTSIGSGSTWTSNILTLGATQTISWGGPSSLPAVALLASLPASVRASTQVV